ncbi:MAG TPA: pyridoxine 5'-phosphate synthase [Candidatus Binataceae bacterium]|nr:pyridoxine 5'-phosphate synthase [Candidatus Binataceae bacterium]
MIKLGVNVDHVATLRQARGAAYPDPAEAAKAAARAGAAAITVHLREDRRHIQDRDLFNIRRAVSIHLNQEMAPTEEMTAIALELRPDEVCLVPERRAELTTEGGLDVAGLKERLAPLIDRLRRDAIKVSLFIDPEPEQVAAAAALGAQFVELHTGSYANLADAAIAASALARTAMPSSRKGKTAPRNSSRGAHEQLDEAARTELDKLRAAIKQAQALKLKPNVGHGLNYLNVHPVAALPGVVWAHIGHAIVARAVIVGMERAVHEMGRLLNPPRR